MLAKLTDVIGSKEFGWGFASVIGFAGLKWFLDHHHRYCSHAGKEPINVCITGAAGQIGYSFIPLLMTGQCFGRRRINLKLLDTPLSEGILKGIELEVLDGAYPLLNHIETGSDPHILFKDADVIIFLGGFPRKPGMERKDLLKINGKIFKEQGKALNEVAKKTCKCLVVANPANTNCLILAEEATTIPKENFTCLTRLDQNRAMTQISIKAGCHIQDVKNVFIWGNHSTTQYPDVNNGTIAGNRIRDVINNDNYLNNEFITKVQNRGGEVLAARKNSSVFSAANAVKDHLHDWYFGTKKGQIVSMGVFSKGEYGVPANLVFSFPVTCSNFNYTVVKGFEIDEFSQQKLNDTSAELLAEMRDSRNQDD